MNTLFSKWLVIALVATFTGCSTYAQFTGDFRTHIANQNYIQAQEVLNESKKGNNHLLYLLENGLIAHYQKRYDESNRYFAAAEKLSDRLYTRAISREAAALITNDAVKKYRGESFELVAIHYYRALNYWYLGHPEDALVECRKANQKLAKYAIHNGETSYKNDAFSHYITGLFYEATGEYNDAYISYQHARDAYQHYAKTLQVNTPPMLLDDLERVSNMLDSNIPNAQLVSLDPTFFLTPTGNGELVIFSEIGFVPRKIQHEIDLPIYDNDIKRGNHVKVSVLAKNIAGRHHHIHHSGNVEYWLRVALPEYETATPQTATVRIRVEDQATKTVPAQNYASIAQASFQDHLPGILAKTTARGLAKYLVYRKAKKENKVLGFFANLFNVATEIADTRSWVSLPNSIQIGRHKLPPGTHTITLDALDASGHIIESQTFDNIEIEPGQRTFINHRVYR